MDYLFSDVAALVQVILIDLALAGDNAIAVGLAASALAPAQQKRVIFIGVLLALVLRIGFALITVQLLAIKGLLLVGGLLLFWVAWRMWQDLSHHRVVTVGEPEIGAAIGEAAVGSKTPPATFTRALISIVIADVSMSLDNVLAVAGVSRHAPTIMAFGLVLSVVLMGVAASFIAGLIQRFRWIATVGVVIIVLAAIRMVWEDMHHFFPAAIPGIPQWLGGAPPAIEAGLRFFTG